MWALSLHRSPTMSPQMNGTYDENPSPWFPPRWNVNPQWTTGFASCRAFAAGQLGKSVDLFERIEAFSPKTASSSVLLFLVVRPGAPLVASLLLVAMSFVNSSFLFLKS